MYTRGLCLAGVGVRTRHLRSFCCLFASLLCAALLPQPAWGDLVANISTGFDQVAGVKLPNASPDPDWVIGSEGSGGFFGTVPTVFADQYPDSMPDAISPGSRWLAIATGYGGCFVPPGTYFFHTDVDLQGYDPLTAQIQNLRYGADNKLLSVRINGQVVWSQPSGFAEEFDSFHDIGSLGLGNFSSGMNLIEFEVENWTWYRNPPANPMAFRMEGLVSAAPVPEPCAGVLFIVGLLALGAARTLRRRGAHAIERG